MKPTTHAAVAAAALASLAGLATAAAKPAHVPLDDVDPLDDVTQGLVIAGDAEAPPPPDAVIAEPVETAYMVPPPQPIADPPEPYDDPPALPTSRRDDYQRESTLLFAGAAQGWLSQRDGLDRFGRGASLGFGFLQRDGHFPSGCDVAATMVRGDGGAVYDLSVRVIGSAKIGRRLAVPYVAIGLVAGASRVEGQPLDGKLVTGETSSWGFGLGPTAALGLHGFLSDKVYWRSGVGFLGAGAGLVTADLALGITMD